MKLSARALGGVVLFGWELASALVGLGACRLFGHLDPHWVRCSTGYRRVCGHCGSPTGQHWSPPVTARDQD